MEHSPDVNDSGFRETPVQALFVLFFNIFY